jgi:hypothetical protein
MILQILGLAAVGVLWINAEPTIRLRLIYKKEDWFFRLINCCMCSSFWISIIYHLITYGSPYILVSSIVSILAEFICRKLNSGSL